MSLVIMAALAVAVAPPGSQASATSLVAKTPQATVTHQDIRNYADALVDIHRVRRDLRDALAKAPSSEDAVLSDQASVLIEEILMRHQLSDRRFNRISYEVEHDAKIRQAVRQVVMEERVGI